MQKTSNVTTTDLRVAEIRAEVPEGASKREAITISDVIDFVDLCRDAKLPLDTAVVTDGQFTGFTVLGRLRAEREVEV